MNEGKSFKETRIIKGRETRILLWQYTWQENPHKPTPQQDCAAPPCVGSVSPPPPSSSMITTAYIFPLHTKPLLHTTTLCRRTPPTDTSNCSSWFQNFSAAAIHLQQASMICCPQNHSSSHELSCPFIPPSLAALSWTAAAALDWFGLRWQETKWKDPVERDPVLGGYQRW
jgi:hypothetical protein